MFNDYFIPFLNLCTKTLNDTRCETEGVTFTLMWYFAAHLIKLTFNKRNYKQTLKRCPQVG